MEFHIRYSDIEGKLKEKSKRGDPEEYLTIGEMKNCVMSFHNNLSNLTFQSSTDIILPIRQNKHFLQHSNSSMANKINHRERSHEKKA